MRFFKETSLTLLMAAASLVPVVADQTALPRVNAALHRELVWTSPHGDELPGLYLVEVADDYMVSRVLVVDPAGNATVISATVDARSGVLRTEVRDDETGWHAALDVVTGVTGESLEAFYSATESLGVGEDHRVQTSVYDSSGVVWSSSWPVAAPRELHRSVGHGLAERSLAQKLMVSAPDGFSQTLAFLDASMSPEPLTSEGVTNVAYALRGIIEVLVASNDVTYTGSEWEMTAGEMKKGFFDPEIVALLSRFRSIDTADPLRDLRIELRGVTE